MADHRVLAPFQARALFLKSRVARQIFFLFLACALAPLVLFAVLTLKQTSAQLEDDAAARLHRECKAVGMSITERIQALGSMLETAFSDPRHAPEDRMNDLPDGLSRRLDSRFEWLAIGAPGALARAGTRTGFELPELSADEQEHLQRQGLLVIFQRRAGITPGVVIVSSLGEGAQGPFVFGHIRASFLWTGDGVFAPDTELVALTDTGECLFSTVNDASFQRGVETSLKDDTASGQFEWFARGEPHVASYRTVFTRPQIGRNFVVARSQPREEVLAPMRSFKQLFLLLAALTLFGIVLASMVQIRRSMVPIEVLKAATARIRQRDFAARADIESKDEFQELGESFNEMAQDLGRHVETLDALHQIGVALTAENSPERLLEIAGTATLEVTRADIVLVHIVDHQRITRIEHIDCRSSGRDVDAVRAAGFAEIRRDPTRAWSSIARQSSLCGETVIHGITGTSGSANVASYDPLEAACRMTVTSSVCAPLRNHEGTTIGVLEAITTEGARRLSNEDRRAIESLASQAAVAITKNRLVDEFRILFESLSELLATAIDEKSEYTGEHCRRVPILTMMLAEEVSAAGDGCFQDFSFTDDQLYELKIAALLHDCGKVVTPVHVVDKATKLETIHDRIELVATRFEVASRDIEIDCLRRALERTDADALEATSREAEESIAALTDDLTFLRRCNIGGEWMSDEAVERVHSIARARRRSDADGNDGPLLTEDEVENLCVRKGTLTHEEREIINYHIVATIKMLETLPYPSYLKGVPEIAGAHHERMDGKGYPQGLQRSQITLQGRILGIADVVEALTAKDRPYKPGKTLSETLTILGHMKEEGHIDPDLFQLFIDSGLYRRYAEQLLDEDQIDEVDFASIPGYTPGPGSRQAA